MLGLLATAAAAGFVLGVPAADVATGGGVDSGTTLLGVAAIITAVGALLGAVVSRRKSGSSDNEDGLIADAKDRIQFLRDTIEERDNALRQCRQDKQLADAEAKLTAMHIGQLEDRLAMTRAELRDARAEQDDRS